MFKLLVIISFEELTLTNETQKEFKLIGIMFGVICELKGTQFHPHIALRVMDTAQQEFKQDHVSVWSLV